MQNTNGCVYITDSLWNLWSVTGTKQDSFEKLRCQWSNVKHLLLSPFYSPVQIFSWCNLAIAPLKAMELCQFMLLRISPIKCYSVSWIVFIDFSNSACWIWVRLWVFYSHVKQFFFYFFFTQIISYWQEISLFYSWLPSVSWKITSVAQTNT